MITLCTTAKAFTGRSRILQINALRSWKALSPDIEIILFGNGEGYSEIANELGLIHLPNVGTTKSGTPLVNSMFALAETHGKFPIKAFVNCDIILMEDFIQGVQKVNFDRFLMVGQRWDIDLEKPINFASSSWQIDLMETIRQNGVLHPPAGSDYFVYKGSIWNNLPDLAVGRAGYDNVLIYKCRFESIPVIDGSPSITAIHQNHDYSHHAQGKLGVVNGADAQLNYKSFSNKEFIFTPVDADWQLVQNRLTKNFCRGDFERYLNGILNITLNRPFRFVLKTLIYLIRLAKRRFSNQKQLGKAT